MTARVAHALVATAVLGAAIGVALADAGAGVASPALPRAVTVSSCGSGEVPYLVGPGVRLVSVEVTGGSGAAGAGNPYGANAPGGKGQTVTAVLAVYPGDELTLRSGCSGQGAKGGPGYRSGGDGGGSGSLHGGGGGGAAAILLDGRPLVVAAGGGGGGTAVNASGGEPGQPGEPGGPDRSGGCTGCWHGGNGAHGGASLRLRAGGGGGGGYPAGGGGGWGGVGGGGGSAFVGKDVSDARLTITSLAPSISVQVIKTFSVSVPCGRREVAPFTVPAGWFTMGVVAIGGSGGANNSITYTGGGRGGTASGTLAVNPGEQFLLAPGCAGAGPPNVDVVGGPGGRSYYGPGGNGGTSRSVSTDVEGGAGGGGASALLQGGQPLLVAGGGGGAGGSVEPGQVWKSPPRGGAATSGAVGGLPPGTARNCGPVNLPGYDANAQACFGGLGGAQSGPAGGNGFGSSDCDRGYAVDGGGMGGGGGGKSGGGGGQVGSYGCTLWTTGGGGGGGSSWAASSITAPQFRPAAATGDGSVTLTLSPTQGPSVLSSVTSDPAMLVLGDTPTFTAQVKGGASGVGVPTGQVTFRLDGFPLGAPIEVNGKGTATSIATAPLALGSHSIVVAYAGDANFDPTTRTISLTVGPTTSSDTISVTPSPLVEGTEAALSARVLPGWKAGPAPTGTVQFSLGGETVGGPVAVGPDGVATSGYTEPVSFGSHVVTASYSGDLNYQPSSATTSVFSPGRTAMQLAASHNPFFPSTETLTLTADVERTPGVAAVPDGTVAFTINGQPSGKPVQLVNGSATTPAIDPSSLTLLTTIDAAYSGSQDFQPSQTSIVLYYVPLVP